MQIQNTVADCHACHGFRRLQHRADDVVIATDIKAKMSSDSQLKDLNLQVTVTKGQVTLAGSVPSDGARLAAYKLASEEKGVGKVNDQMTAESAQAAPAPSAEPTPPPPPPAAPVRKKHVAKRVVPHSQETDSLLSARARATAGCGARAHTCSCPSCTGSPSSAFPPPPQPKVVEVPAGATVSIRIIHSVDSSVNATGE